MNCARAYKSSAIIDVFVPQTNGEISESIVQNWTPQAIECYTLGHNCKMCSITSGNYSFVCQMPKIVKELLKIWGKPALKDPFSE